MATISGIARPVSLEGVLDVLDEDPATQVLAGGTDFMVEVNYGHRKPQSIVALSRVAGMRTWQVVEDHLVIGAGVTYSRLMKEQLAGLVPGLAQAARTVGSPQIRNAGTIGGNLGTASPAGDSLPILLALDALVNIRSKHSSRSLRVDEYVIGPKKHALQPGEIIVSVRIPLSDTSQEFLKVGTRNAMVISVAGLALVVDWRLGRVGCGLGSVGPTPIRASEAEAWLAGIIDWEERRIPDRDGYGQEFGRLVARAASPIDDHRSSAAYRSHALSVCGKRAYERICRQRRQVSPGIVDGA
ncbi:MAG: FAD binding domain-containing protein [Actinobacteria bacterium]|nr:FAD binding domain-containing protein [Actinomycetota bacterium]MCL5447180.1 FAD binding domain-containing protein [Actinomycetota bacterium]